MLDTGIFTFGCTGTIRAGAAQAAAIMTLWAWEDDETMLWEDDETMRIEEEDA